MNKHGINILSCPLLSFLMVNSQFEFGAKIAGITWIFILMRFFFVLICCQYPKRQQINSVQDWAEKGFIPPTPIVGPMVSSSRASFWLPLGPGLWLLLHLRDWFFLARLHCGRSLICWLSPPGSLWFSFGHVISLLVAPLFGVLMFSRQAQVCLGTFMLRVHFLLFPMSRLYVLGLLSPMDLAVCMVFTVSLLGFFFRLLGTGWWVSAAWPFCPSVTFHAGYTCMSYFLVDFLLVCAVFSCMSLGSCQSCCLGRCAGRSGCSPVSWRFGAFCLGAGSCILCCLLTFLAVVLSLLFWECYLPCLVWPTFLSTAIGYVHFGVLILVSLSVRFCLCLSLPYPVLLQHLQYMSPFGHFGPLPLLPGFFPGLAHIGNIHASLHGCCGWVVPCFLVTWSFSCFIDGSISWYLVSWAVVLVSGTMLFSWSGLHVTDPVTWYAVLLCTLFGGWVLCPLLLWLNIVLLLLQSCFDLWVVHHTGDA